MSFVKLGRRRVSPFRYRRIRQIKKEQGGLGKLIDRFAELAQRDDEASNQEMDRLIDKTSSVFVRVVEQIKAKAAEREKVKELVRRMLESEKVKP